MSVIHMNYRNAQWSRLYEQVRTIRTEKVITVQDWQTDRLPSVRPTSMPNILHAIYHELDVYFYWVTKKSKFNSIYHCFPCSPHIINCLTVGLWLGKLNSSLKVHFGSYQNDCRGGMGWWEMFSFQKCICVCAFLVDYSLGFVPAAQ